METLVVAAEVLVDVWVVDSDVIWHPKDVLFFWPLIISFSAGRKKAAERLARTKQVRVAVYIKHNVDVAKSIVAAANFKHPAIKVAAVKICNFLCHRRKAGGCHRLAC